LFQVGLLPADGLIAHEQGTGGQAAALLGQGTGHNALQGAVGIHRDAGGECHGDDQPDQRAHRQPAGIPHFAEQKAKQRKSHQRPTTFWPGSSPLIISTTVGVCWPISTSTSRLVPSSSTTCT